MFSLSDKFNGHIKKKSIRNDENDKRKLYNGKMVKEKKNRNQLSEVLVCFGIGNDATPKVNAASRNPLHICVSIYKKLFVIQ